MSNTVSEEEINEYMRTYHSSNINPASWLIREMQEINIPESNHFGSGGIHYSVLYDTQNSVLGDTQNSYDYELMQNTRKTEDLLGNCLDKIEDSRKDAMKLLHMEQDYAVKRELKKEVNVKNVEVSEEKIMNNKVDEVHTLIQDITTRYKDIHEKYEPIIKKCEDCQTRLNEMYELKKKMGITRNTPDGNEHDIKYNVPEYLLKISEIINKEIYDKETELSLLKKQVSDFIDKSSNMINAITRYKAFSPVEENTCNICLDKPKNMFFQCGHTYCEQCGIAVKKCPMCKVDITSRHKLYF